MNPTYDLIVVGGGPAGTAAAITAAHEGWSVLLLERDRFPRHKVCGEFVSAESLELLSWLLGDAKRNLLERSLPIAETRLLADDRVLRIPVRPAAASISRHDLDLALWQAAVDAGVSALAKATVHKIERSQLFRVATAVGEYSARALINASGRWSNLTDKANQTSGSRWLGIKAHCHGEMEAGTELYFFNGGYCGVQPVLASDSATMLNVCGLVRPGVAGSLRDLLRCHPVLESRSCRWEAAFPALSTFPIFFREPLPVCGSMLNTGDAAGFVDPFVGDGISLALRGGHLAARCLSAFLRADCELQASLRTYAHTYRRSLRPVYRASSILRKLLSVPRPLRTPFLAACEFSPRLAQYLVTLTRSRAADTLSTMSAAAQL